MSQESKRAPRFRGPVLWSIAGQGVQRGGAFVTLAVVARALALEEFGQLSLAVVSATLIVSIVSFGLDTALLRHLASGRRSEPRPATVLTAKSILSVPALIMGLGYLGIALDVMHVAALTPILVGGVLVARAETAETVLISKRRYHSIALSSGVAAATAVACAVLVSALRVAGTGALLSFSLVLVFRDALRHALASRLAGRAGWEATGGVAAATALLRANREFAYIALSAFLYSRTDVFLLGVLLDRESVGIYAPALQVYLGAVALMAAIGPVLLQRAVERDATWSAMLVDLRVSGIMGLCVASALAILAPILVKVSFGDGYEGAGTMLRILAMAVPFNYCNSVLLRYLYAKGAERRVRQGLSAVLIVAIPVNWGLISAQGANGAALATVCVELILGLVFLATYKASILGFKRK